MNQIRLLAAARQDQLESVDWYKRISPDLARRFLSAVRETLETLARQPDRYPEIWPGTREAPVSRWPYCIYYKIGAGFVLILAIYHCSRDMTTIRTRPGS